MVRDIIYGWARVFVGVGMAKAFKPQTFTQEARNNMSCRKGR